MINLDDLLKAYIEEAERRTYCAETIGRELVAVRNAFDRAEIKKRVR